MDDGLIISHIDQYIEPEPMQVNPSATPFLEILNENVRIISQMGVTANEIRDRFGFKPMGESNPKGHLNANDLVPNPEP